MSRGLRRIRVALLALFLGTVMLVAAGGTASAGGPTSVVLFRGEQIAGFYYTDPRYDQLSRLLDATTALPAGAPAPVESDSIQVSWLAHDTYVYQVDTLKLSAEGPIYLTRYEVGSEAAVAEVWREVTGSAELRVLFAEVAMLDEVVEPVAARSPAPSVVSVPPSPAAVVPPQNGADVVQPALDPSASIDPGVTPGWAWALSGAAAGVALAMVGGWVVRRRRGIASGTGPAQPDRQDRPTVGVA